MAMANFSMCLVLVLYQLSTAYSDEQSLEADHGIKAPKSDETDSLRCFCNTADCVTTSYMCRSRGNGGCYSELPAPMRAHEARHGCLHHLADTDEQALARCQGSPSDHSHLQCCFKDMCNHVDDPIARAKLNWTLPDADGSGVVGDHNSNYNSEVWFKAATIAVPVCGAMILFLLVAVAVRLLKADALLHANRKLRYEGGYMAPPHNSPEDVKKVWVGGGAPLLVTPGGCLVAVERAQLVDCDIQR